MRLLVSGGAGYIGSAVVSELLAAGHEVTVYDNLSHGYVAAVPKGAEFVQGDIADSSGLATLLKRSGIEAVLHFAALIEAGESMQAPERYFQNNTMGTLTLLQAMLNSNVKRLVFSSTAAVYGQPEQVPIPEEHKLQPTNAYGESKLLVERMLAWFHRVHDMRYASLRYFNAAGATAERGESHVPETHLIPLVLQVAMGQREAISVYGDDYETPDGTCVRDYIHVTDLATAHVLALEALAERTQLIYNLGNGTGFSVLQVIEMARRVTRHPIPAVTAPRRAGDPAILVASSDRIRHELKWKPRYPELQTILETAWQWMKKNPNGWRASSAS